MAGVSRPSKAIWNAFNGAFQRMVHRRRPVPVGSRLINAMYTHLRAAASFGKCPRARTALRIRALTLSIAFVEQMTLRISTSNAEQCSKPVGERWEAYPPDESSSGNRVGPRVNAGREEYARAYRSKPG